MENWGLLLFDETRFLWNEASSPFRVSRGVRWSPNAMSVLRVCTDLGQKIEPAVFLPAFSIALQALFVVLQVGCLCIAAEQIVCCSQANSEAIGCSPLQYSTCL